VWAGVLGNQLIGPHIIFDITLTEPMYLDFLQHTRPTLLDGLDQNQRDRIIFQQDCAPPHFTELRDWLSLNYSTWIGRGGSVA